MKVTLPAAALWQGSKATQECSIGFLLTSALLMSVIWSSPPVGILFCLPVCQIGRPVSVFLHTKWAIVCPFVSECRPHAEEMWRVKTHMEQKGSASEYSQTDDSIPQLAKEKLTKLIVDDWKKKKDFSTLGAFMPAALVAVFHVFLCLWARIDKSTWSICLVADSVHMLHMVVTGGPTPPKEKKKKTQKSEIGAVMFSVFCY